MPERGHAEPKRGTEWWGKSLLLPFCWAGTPAFEKGSRCKSETISRRYRSNGYTPRPILIYNPTLK
ncbi:hypothetical protein PSUM_02500 [Pseudomonas umsongensis]|uniref:Uncharacterized protein n=1 Tax=Pseudomonas umsongensis TaxID=198618 RepID=A0ABX4E0G2_9PSED|nr:hypothetical protein PSUM_02500 [Pseudomonas umsongensis]